MGSGDVYHPAGSLFNKHFLFFFVHLGTALRGPVLEGERSTAGPRAPGLVCRQPTLGWRSNIWRGFFNGGRLYVSPRCVFYLYWCQRAGLSQQEVLDYCCCIFLRLVLGFLYYSFPCKSPCNSRRQSEWFCLCKPRISQSESRCC